jgi:hypothetical protein
MNIARAKTEAQIRAAIAGAEVSASQELAWSRRCHDPKNVQFRRRNAEVYREIASEYRHALAEHLLLDAVAYHPMPEKVQ